MTSELSDERFRGDAVGQALDVERAERLRLSRENRELQVGGEEPASWSSADKHLLFFFRLVWTRVRSPWKRWSGSWRRRDSELRRRRVREQPHQVGGV